MKLAVNRCFGGFSLSHEGIMHYANLKGIQLFRYFDAHTKRIFGDDYHKGCAHYTTKPIPGLDGDVLPEYGGKYKNTPEHDALNEFYFSDHEIERNDSALIQTIEDLGERAFGQCAKLEIVEVPDDVEWEISEYDGSEHVAEKHRTW